MLCTIANGGVCTPLGFTANAVAANVKGKNTGKLDMTLLVSDTPCTAAAVFTTNVAQAAPVKFDKKRLEEGSEFFGVLVNSGNANACTGAQGIVACATLTSAIEEGMELPAGSILMASTGVIGVQLPVDRMLGAVEELLSDLNDEAGSEFAHAIMTTDTFPKEVAVLVETPKGTYVVGGSTKGAGMIAPEMATMLTFITTDAQVSQSMLQQALAEAMGTTFNAITVDGDMSTNDTVFLLANGMSGITVHSGEEYEEFRDAVKQVCLVLAQLIVKDGEGATKLVGITVENAATEEDAKKVALKIANSPLVKTMFAGCDPNWGRLMASAGAAGVSFDPEQTEIWFNTLKYVENGTLIDPALEAQVYEIMKEETYRIRISLNTGKEAFTAYTCDLTKEYIAINADYRS